MSTNPFAIDVVISGQGRKLFEQLDGLSLQEAQGLLEGGYFTALREAKKAGTLPPIDQLRAFLTGQYVLNQGVAVRVWKIWKKIKIGTGIKRGVDFCTEMKKQDIITNDQVRDMLRQKAFTIATVKEGVALVVLSVTELGFKEGARYDAICTRAVELGLELCPAEVGPQLRWQYLDQPLGEWLVIAMEAIRDSSGHLHIFGVVHGGAGRWLSSHDGSPGSFWDAGSRFVFRSRRKA